MSYKERLALVIRRFEKTLSSEAKIGLSILIGAVGPAGIDSLMTLIYGSAGGWVKMVALVIELALPSATIYLLWGEIHRLRNSALIDPLSGLYNRRGGDDIFFAQLSNIFRQRRDGKQAMVAVAFIDIDLFKSINDTYGHAAGDTVIKELGRLLREFFQRSTDVCIRQGGDEFVVILPKTRDIVVKPKMETLASLVAESSIGKNYHVTLSIGIASKYISRDETKVSWYEQLAEIFTLADSALSLAKKRRNCIRILREEAASPPSLISVD